MGIPMLGGNKKKSGGLMWAAITLAVLIIFGMIVVSFWKGVGAPAVASSTGAAWIAEASEEQQAEEAVAAGITEKEINSCDGVQSVNLLWNDRHAYTATTDPGQVITLFEANGNPYSKAIADDATSSTVPILSELKGLAGNNLGSHNTSYFGKEISFSTMCADYDLQKEMIPATAPTLTLTNDNGVTLNSDTNHESMTTDSTYSPTLTVKSASNACASVYGAVVAVDYDASYISMIEAGDGLESFSGSYLETKVNPTNGTSDQTTLLFFPGELCDGKKVDLGIDVTSHATTEVGEDNGVQIHWYPLNKDLDSDTLSKVITGLYDDKNTLISIGNTSIEYFVA